MLRWSFMFLVIALIAGVLGFGAVSGAAVQISKVLFFIFLILWAIALGAALIFGDKLSSELGRKS